MPDTQPTGEEQLKEFEDGYPPLILDISQRRRQAQDNLMSIVGADSTGPITRAQAHERLMYPKTDVELELAGEAGYNIVFGGLGFAGYAEGPLLVGGLRGQEIANRLGSYNIATGLLTNETLEGARLYCSHLCSYVEYDFGLKKIKVTNPGSPNPIIEEEVYGEDEES